MGRSKLGSVGTDFEARYWLSLDPCGLLCLSFSYGLHLFALVASGLVLTSHHVAAQCLYGVLYVPLSTLALWSLTMAAATDPGAVPMGARPLPGAGEEEGVVVERDDVRGGLRRRRGVRRCRKCNDNYKPARAHHDSVTGRCVVKMDHFCPWVGNAVGIMNHKASGRASRNWAFSSHSSTFIIIVVRIAFAFASGFAPALLERRHHHQRFTFLVSPSSQCYLTKQQFFILFILYTFLTSIVSLVLILIRVIRCQYYVLLPPSHTNSTADATVTSNYIDVDAMLHYRHSIDHSHAPPPHPGCDSDQTVVILALSIITVLFFLFTFCMLLEQTEAISTNMSKIARMKTRGGMVSHPNEYAPVATEFNEVFGGEHPTMSWHWALPLSVRFPEWAVDNVMGFEYHGSREEVAGPYREPSETDGENSSVISMSSGMSSSLGDSGGGVGGIGIGGRIDGYLGTVEVGPVTGGMDVERGGLLLEDKEEISPPSTLSGGGVKKRSTNGSLT
ncbi:hypothetical protein ACHAW5_008778 [Stephanodiscus triporus]|uniref:Palmitoyltransferase n=1 Tax=Stephanodiscus triporus TaxID=2934178 RepID=A0ABD3N9I9_9STRA